MSQYTYKGLRKASSCRRTAVCLLAVCLAAHLTPVLAQFKLQQTFTDTTAPGWTLIGSSFLTAPSIDPAGQGWLRLTDTGNNEKGLALDTSESFAGNVPVTVRFSYVSWGGTGADGITVFLYDSTQNMGGASNGGGLGYCGGAGGYLALAWTSTAIFPTRATSAVPPAEVPGACPSLWYCAGR